MRDYNKPPTDEFAMKEMSLIRNDLNGWFTLMKSVMNDYWFDRPPQPHHIHGSLWANRDYVDHFMHKMYYCWMMMGVHLHGHDPRRDDDDV